MTTRRFRTTLLALLTAAAAGALLVAIGRSRLPVSAAQAHQPLVQNAPPQLAALQAEVERLKGIVPDQAHAMKDVDYHFTNLWFAGRSANWPLADFYWKETVSHMKWAVRIIPVRKDNAGREVKLEEILQAIEMTPAMQMATVIEQQNQEKFEPTYRALLEGCYSCHKAADKPFLRPKIPDRSTTSIMNFDPQATWPM
jgi:hypothetical protein